MVECNASQCLNLNLTNRCTYLLGYEYIICQFIKCLNIWNTLINPIPHDLLERRCYMTLGQYDPELIFGFISQQMAMLASKLVSDRILDILTSIYINISTFKGLCPSIYVLQTWSMSAYWDFENQKSIKGSPFSNGKKFLSLISLKFYVWNP